MPSVLINSFNLITESNLLFIISNKTQLEPAYLLPLSAGQIGALPKKLGANLIQIDFLRIRIKY